MWATLIPGSSRPIISATHLPQPPESFPAATSSAFTRRRTQRSSASPQDVGGLGKAVIGAFQSGAKPTGNPQQGNEKKKKMNVEKQKQYEPEKEEKGKEISGSDILRALQKATARKAQVSGGKKTMQNRNRTGQSMNRRESATRVVDYDKVRPLNIKSDWATRLDELEKRLQQFKSI